MKNRIYALVLIMVLCVMLGGCSTRNISKNISGGTPSYSTTQTEDPADGDDDFDSSSESRFGEQSGDTSTRNFGTGGGTGTNEADDTESNDNAADTPNITSTDTADAAYASDSDSEPEAQGGDSSYDNADEGGGAEEDAGNVCRLLVDCGKALEYDGLSSSLRGVLPADGVMYSGDVSFTPGETVFDILSRVLKDNNIPMEFSSSISYDSKYIEGIGSLYEFDCGELSGWVYFVNGTMPNYGCDKYTVSSGDDVRWYYTRNMGLDIEI